MKVIQEVFDKTLIEKLLKIVEKQMNFIGSKHDHEKIRIAIKNAQKNNRTVFFVKINETDEFIGFAFCNICSGLETGADYLWINEIYVESEYRRKGKASEILKFIEKWAKDKGIKYIATMTSKKNNGSKSLFKNMEYELEEILWIDKNI